MFMKTFTLLGTLLFCSLVMGQQVLLTYEVNTLEDQSVELTVYAQSATPSSFDLAALNTSVALPEGCIALEAGQNMMLDSWTDYLERGTEIENLDLQYGDLQYTARFQYGNANPGLPATSEIILPPAEEQAPVLFTRTFKGNCQNLYLEHQSENGLNQLTGPDMVPVTYSIQHPERPAEVLETTSLFQVEAAPNPTADWIYITIPEVAKGWYSVKVFDIHGGLVFTQEKEMGPSLDNTTAVDLRNEAAGIYIVEVVNLGQAISQAVKVLKQQ